MIYDLSNSDDLSVFEGRFPTASLFTRDYSYFIFGIAFHVAVMGEDRNFKFGTCVDRTKS